MNPLLGPGGKVQRERGREWGATGFAGLFFIIILAFHIVPPASLGLSAPPMPERAKGLCMVQMHTPCPQGPRRMEAVKGTTSGYGG